MPAVAHPPSRWTISSAWMRGVAELLQSHGLDVRALFREAGLDLRVLDQSDGRVPVEQVDRLWHVAALRSGQPSVALSRADVDTPSSFDLLAYSMMSCETLGDAVVRLVLYRTVVSDAVDLHVDQVTGGIRISVTPMEPPMQGRAQRLDYTLVTFLGFCRWVTCRKIVPLGVELSYAAPPDLTQHRSAFGCTPTFNATRHALLLRQTDLQLPLPNANATLNRLHDRVVQEHVRGLHPTGIEGRLAASLVRRIGSGRVRRADAAADLCMSERTLQRRLVEAGTSFQQELDTLRRHLAENYLQDTALPLAAIAPLLGFAEESTLYRACQRWFSRAPRQLRAEVSASR